MAHGPPDAGLQDDRGLPEKDNGKAIRSVCAGEFIVLCRDLKLFSEAIVAIDGSKFKAVNNRDKNFTDRKLKARMQQLEDSIARYMTELDRADREPLRS